LVVDTNIVASASKEYVPYSLLVRIEGHRAAQIAVNPEIEAEYRPFLASQLLVQWHRLMAAKGKFFYVSGRAPSQLVSDLVNELGFHHKDLKFVHAGYRARARALVYHGDEANWSNVSDYLLSNAGFRVVPIGDAVHLLDES